jgi:hypothetical protein
MVEIRNLDLDQITIDKAIQPREGLHQKPLKALTQLLQEDGAEAVPPVVVFYDHDSGGVYWLADGHYRITAARNALSNGGPQVLRADVREGTKRDAICFAAGANQHGTQLTNEEKRRVIIRLLQDDEWGQWSSREIARHVGVSNSFVSGIRNEFEAQETSVLGEQISPKETVKARRGKQEYPMKKRNTGRSRGSKVNTALTTATPDSPAIIQDEPITDEDEEHITEDDKEVVESGTTMGISRTDSSLISDSQRLTGDSLRDSDDDNEVVVPKGFVDLIDAWFRATSEERRTFLDWARRPVDEAAGSTTPAQHAYYHLIAREPLQDMAEEYAAMRE